MNSQDITQLKALLTRMQQEDTNFRVFGSEEHQYRLQPTLSEHELRAFEENHQITLPEDYRFFLREVGNGGAGPDYGLLPLKEAAAHHDLSKPFPFTESTEELPVEVWEQLEASDSLDRNGGVGGVLRISHQGCGSYAYLVVNGPAYGMVWYGQEDYEPTGWTFTDWYRQWVAQLGNDNF